jgi:hypothetical protein
MIFQALGSALAVLLVASPVFAGHGATDLNSHQATPGIQIELIELPAGQSGGAVQYRLRSTGVPRDVTFDVWAKDFRQPFREIAAGFRINAAGALVSIDFNGSRPQRLDAMALGPGPYPLGAAWEVALVSSDRTITAFARVIPRPIVVRDGPCTVFLELASARGERFVASGTGFVPGDDVIVESQFSGRVNRRQVRITAEGMLPPDDISHAPIGSDRSARYAVKGRACEVTLEYRWGAPALQRR